MHVSSLSILYRDTNAVDLYDILLESVCSCLRLIEYHLIDQLKHKPDDHIKPLKAHHFYPDGFGHYFTCFYPIGISDDGKIFFNF